MKMIYNVPLGSGLNPYEPLHHHIIGSVIGSLVGGALGLVGNAQQASYTKEQQKLQSKLNKEEMATSQGMQNAQQDWLMNTQYGKMVSGMKNAGLNPATANGTTPSVPSAGHGSSGGVGPAFHGESLAAAASQGALAGKDVEMADAQIENIKAQTDKTREETDDQKFKNTPTYRELTLRGMDEDIKLSVCRQKEANSNVDLNTQKVAESAQNVKESLSRIGVNTELANKYANESVEVTYRIAGILQDMKESEARIAVHRATAKCQRALANLHDKAAKGLDITNEDLERTLTARKAVTLQGDDGYPKSYWGKQAENEGKSGAIAADILQYEYDMLSTMTPAQRQKYLMTRDAAGLAIGAFGAIGSTYNGMRTHHTERVTYAKGNYVETRD